MSSLPGANRRLLTVRVKTRSARSGVSTEAEGGLIVRLHAPPDKGRANQELRELLARHFGLPVSGVRILRGAASRVKVVEISGG